MKHSAKAVAKLAREREKDARRVGQAPVAPAVSTVSPMASTVTPAASAVSAATSTGRQRLNQLPYALVLAGVLAGLLLMRAGGLTVRGGTLVIAGALLAGSITRLVLPESRAGLLGSRRRLVDVAMLTALGVGLLIAGLVVQVSG